MNKNNSQIRFNDFISEVEDRKIEYSEAINRILSSGWFILGKEVESFEKEFAGYLDSRYCIGVGNGLEALQISLTTLGVGEGDEVITTPLSAFATTLAIIAVGAIPIFVDVKENGQIDEELIALAITKKTKAILPVHLYGQSADIVKIKNICCDNGLFLIEDACQAHGSSFLNKKLGTWGDIGCFSFYPTKNLGCFGDGGAIVTNNDRYAQICREIRDYGQASKYRHVRYGLNSRLDEIQAAILRIKLKYLNFDNKKRRRLAEEYIKLLSGVTGVGVILPEDITKSNFHLFVIKSDKRDKLQNFLKQESILSLIHYPVTIPDQPMFNGKYADLTIPVARKMVNEVLSLPCHPYLNVKEVDFVCSTIKSFL